MDQPHLKNNTKKERKISNQLNKICSKLQISLKDANNEDALSKSVKLKIQKYIQKDDIKKLQTFLDDNVLDYDIQIGIKSMKWNILHFAAKNNSFNIIKVILTKTYQQCTQRYTQLVNSKTSQGYTPLMIAIIYSSNESFLLFLQYGGINISETDNKSMKAYDLALSYKNQFAIRELMNYLNTHGKKKNQFINQDSLMKPIDPNIFNVNCYSKVFGYFVDCFLCFNRNVDENQLFQKQLSTNVDKQSQQNPQQSFFKKSFHGSKLMSLLSYMQDDQSLNIDTVKIGNQQVQAKYSIQWKRLTTATNQKPVLFDCFQPFDICQNNLIIANNLITFQCLSDHTWLVRKILKPIKREDTSGQFNTNSNNLDKPKLYTIQIYLNDQLKKITVDQHIPFLKQREQPMFLSDVNEMWPQILQKGLAKIYGSYMKLSQIKPLTLIQNFTGNYTKQFDLVDGQLFLRESDGQFITNKKIMSALQQFNSKGCLILLQGRQGSTLSPKNSSSSFKSYCYTILQFYQKGSKRLILVNCPYVINAWKQKEKTESMQLKRAKTHYNSHNQMCVWIQESQFAHFFKSVIVSFAEPNLTRTQLKIRYLLQNQIQILEQRKSLTFQTITNSVKSIFSPKNDENQIRSPATSNANVEKGDRNSQLPLNLSHGKRVVRLVFIKFKLDNSKNSQNFSLAVKDNLSHKYCKINKFRGWINGGFQDVDVEQKNPLCPDLITIQQKKGQYLCMLQVQFFHEFQSRQSYSINQSVNSILGPNYMIANQNKQYNKKSDGKKSNGIQGNNVQVSNVEVKKIKKHELLVVCWSQDSVQLENIEEQFAMIEWIQSWRKYSMKNWAFLDKRCDKKDATSPIKYLAEQIGNKIVVMAKSNKDIEFSFSLQGEQSLTPKIQNYIYQGHAKQVQQVKSKDSDDNLNQYLVNVEMVRDPQHNQFQYVVLGADSKLIDLLKEQNYQLNYVK